MLSGRRGGGGGGWGVGNLELTIQPKADSAHGSGCRLFQS